MMNIIPKKELNKDEKAFTEVENENYEIANGVDFNYAPFHFVAKENEEVLGVISGFACYAEIYIDGVVVKEQERAKGVGRKLLQTVEDSFTGKGFNNINLVTNGFQAPGFYEKCGYALEFIRKNKANSKLDKYFYVKFFA